MIGVRVFWASRIAKGHARLALGITASQWALLLLSEHLYQIESFVQAVKITRSIFLKTNSLY